MDSIVITIKGSSWLVEVEQNNKVIDSKLWQPEALLLALTQEGFSKEQIEAIELDMEKSGTVRLIGGRPQ